MIEEQWRYFAPGGVVMPGGPSTWYVLDWDQRRIIAVTMDDEQEEEDLAIGHLKKHIKTLGNDVRAIRVSKDGSLVSVSTDPEDDQTTCVFHPPLSGIRWLNPVLTVLRSQLLELDRLAPNVDLVEYSPSVIPNSKKLVFKYYFLLQFIQPFWHELNLWMRLPQHSNIVPFDRVVIDELRGDVVGFTTLYVPGGTLEENRSRLFRLEWLTQLTSVVDDLNLKYGITHQDIAARNLLVDPQTNAILLFDFNYSARIGAFGYTHERNDVKGTIFTIYEIITRDNRFRTIPYEQRDPLDVEEMEQWIQHPEVKLDHPVSEYRSVLKRWVQKRREGKQITKYTEAPEYIDWTDLPEPPLQEVIFEDPYGNQSICHEQLWFTIRRDEREKGHEFLIWERQPQK